MFHQRLIARSILYLASLFFTLLIGNSLQAQDGKTLFLQNCATCHNPLRIVVGPALKGVTSRVPDQKLLHSWIKNNASVLASGNKYFSDLTKQFGGSPMNLFPNLTDAEINSILSYVDSYKEPGPP